jgi:hypothetical protein
MPRQGENDKKDYKSSDGSNGYFSALGVSKSKEWVHAGSPFRQVIQKDTQPNVPFAGEMGRL